MPLFQLFLASLLLFAAVGAVVLVMPSLRGMLLRRKSMLAAVAISVLLSAGSYLVSESDASGTGTRTSQGFPKPYHFTWESWEQPISQAGVNWLYFIGNCIGWLSVVSLALAIWLAAREWARRRRTPVA